jgi:hypothetical protein
MKLYGMKRYNGAGLCWEDCGSRLFASQEACAIDFMEKKWPDVVDRSFEFWDIGTHPYAHLNSEFFETHKLVRFFIEYEPTPLNPYTKYTSDAHLIFQFVYVTEGERQST